MLNFSNAQIITDKNPMMSQLQDKYFIASVIISAVIILLSLIIKKKKIYESLSVLASFLAYLSIGVIIMIFVEAPNSTAKIEVVDIDNKIADKMTNSNPYVFKEENGKLYYIQRVNNKTVKKTKFLKERTEKQFKEKMSEALSVESIKIIGK